MNSRNLKPFNTWDPEEHRAVSRKAGIASGLSRRRKAAIREIAYSYLTQVQIANELERLAYRGRRNLQRALCRRRARLNREGAKRNTGDRQEPGNG